MDASGKSLRPSILLGELKKLFPQLTAVAASDEAAGIPFSIREARGRLTRGLRNYGISREDSEFLELFRHFMMNEEQRESVEKLVAGEAPEEDAEDTVDLGGGAKEKDGGLYAELLELSRSHSPEEADEPTEPTRRIDFDHLQFGKDYEIK